MFISSDDKNKITYSTDGNLSSDFLKILNEYNFRKVDRDGEYFFPSDYNPCENVAKKLNYSNSKYLYVMNGCDVIGSKVDLWKVIKNEFKNDASKIMPECYLYENSIDMINLQNRMNIEKNNNIHQMYILKNYEQRQEGLKLIDSWSEVMDPINMKKFYIIQEYLYNPYIINKRKVNFRVYYLVVCSHNNYSCYIYNNGFMYYTPEFYDPNKKDFNKHITTGYIDRQVYVENPLTREDFRQYLGQTNANLLDENTKVLMHNVSKVLSTKTCLNNDPNNKIFFQIYGVDVQPDANLNVKLIEINKGPDLNSKDERDGQVKYKMQQDLFKIINPAEFGITTNFIKVY
jgi:tubulin polyglutamylase TTLL4